jgi:arsenite methyltransferase
MSIPAIYHLVLESLSRRELTRVPEPDLVMKDLSRNEAFAEVGGDEGILAFHYFYHALQITPVVKPGDKVLDIACGPANQLALIARFNPLAKFVGLDASANMLERAAATLTSAGVSNVELVPGDMTAMTSIKDASMDCVICTMSMHHLPDMAALSKTMQEVKRVLKPGGGFYIVDFGRLKRKATQDFFVHDNRDLQSANFTLDYLNSIKAAFSVGELTSALKLVDADCERYVTSLASFMVVFKSKNRRELDTATRQLVREIYRQLPISQQQSFQSFAKWFHTGGLNLPFQVA